MNNLQTFNFKDQPIRTVMVENEPHWVLKDVCEVLGISNSRMTAERLEDDEVSQTDITDSLGRNQRTTIITESGLYAVILRSDKPNAKEFRKWVTSEVLPAIRKHGAYLTDQKAAAIITNKDALAELLLQAGQQLKEKELLIEQMKPKALFADAVASSKTSILIGQLAKILTQNGYEIGQNRLFAKLREEGYLSNRKGTDWNMPTQRYVEQGLFEIKESTHIDGNGVNITTKTVKVSGKGQQYFINKFLAN